MDLIKKITAPNPSVFTGQGTNTYLIGNKDITLIDPGPNIQEHIDEIIKLGDGNIKRIVVTHTHTDHSPAALPISKILNVPMYGKLVDGDSTWEDETFYPDVVLKDLDKIKTEEYILEAIHTPGHASNHLCYLVHDASTLITGDHIMNGSTVVIAPPDGSMTEYLDSLKKLEHFKIKFLAPGHGDYLDNPKMVIEWIINHRLTREDKVLQSMQKLIETSIEDLLLEVYDDVDPKLHPIALWSLEAHLIRLQERNLVSKKEANWKIND